MYKKYGLIKHDPGDLRFPNFSDVTTKPNIHVRGHPLLGSHVTDRVASEAVWTKTGVQRALGRKSEACET